MQYIKKSGLQPADWDHWFTLYTADGNRRSFDYKADYAALPDIPAHAKQFLLNEQYGLCAYCQGEITLGNSSIEHVIPKSANVHLSTSYHNLVAVCNEPVKDPATGKRHCDKERGDKILPHVIFYADADCTAESVHSYFNA